MSYKIIFTIVSIAVILSSLYIAQKVHRVVNLKWGKWAFAASIPAFILCLFTIVGAITVAAEVFMPFGR